MFNVLDAAVQRSYKKASIKFIYDLVMLIAIIFGSCILQVKTRLKTLTLVYYSIFVLVHTCKVEDQQTHGKRLHGADC